MTQTSINQIYQEVQKAIDYAFEGKFTIDIYEYFKTLDVKRDLAEEFMKSLIADELSYMINDLEEYLIGGNDDIHKQLREGYGHISKPEARKIMNYLKKMLDDAEKYHYDKRPGRRSKQTK